MINIQDIIPYLKAGWVAMDKDGFWCWYEKKPKLSKKDEIWHNPNFGEYTEVETFAFQDIAPADDWKQSLIKIEGEK